jgi:glycosyltransferase involved in cell wall biosynthesis
MARSDPWSELSPRVVAVSGYEGRDGIGRYADQMITAYGRGREFVRVGIPERPGDYSRPLYRGIRALWLLRDARRRDDVLLHYHPEYYVRGDRAARVASYLSWGVLALLRRVVLVSHEPDPRTGRLEEAVRRWAWRRVHRVVFHSEWELERWLKRYGRARRQAHSVVAHGDFFATAVSASRAEARSRLGLPYDRVILLMIGYLSVVFPDKGYDRVIAALDAAGDPAVDLHIVGSPIRPGPEVDALIEWLRAVARDSPHVFLHEEYVDHDDFDLWIRAADAVVTAYRTASSSSVVARARLLGTPVIISAVGGLAEQAGPGDMVVLDDDELLAAIRAVAHGSGAPSNEPSSRRSSSHSA